jgi:4-hydroxybenzoate polyprenyltransferase
MSQSPPPVKRRDLTTLLNPPLLVAAAVEAIAGAYLAGEPFVGLRPFLLGGAAALLFAAGSAFTEYFHRLSKPGPAPGGAPEGEPATPLLWRVGWLCLLAGAALPALVGKTALLIGIGAALCLVLFAAVTQEIWGLGFLTWGAAHGLTLLLGISARSEVFSRYAPAALPVLLLAVGLAIMRHSRQPGAPGTTGFMSLVHVTAAMTVLLYLAANSFNYRVDALPFLFLTLALALPRLVMAIQDPRRPAAVVALQYGFMALAVTDATLAAGYAGIRAGVLVGLLALVVFRLLRSWPLELVTEPR